MDAVALSSGVCSPVDFCQGFHVLITAACGVLRYGVQPLAISVPQ